MNDRWIDRLSFLLVGITVAWLAFVLLTLIDVDPLHVGLYAVLPLALVLAFVIAVLLVRQRRYRFETHKQLDQLSQVWEPLESDSDSQQQH